MAQTPRVRPNRLSFGPAKPRNDNDDGDSSDDGEFIPKADSIPHIDSFVLRAMQACKDGDASVVNNDTTHCELCDIMFSRIMMRFKFNCSSCGQCICSRCHVKSAVQDEDGNFEWYRKCVTCQNVERQQNADLMKKQAKEQRAREKVEKKERRGVERMEEHEEGEDEDDVEVVAIEDTITLARQIIANSDEKRLNKILCKTLKHDEINKAQYEEYCTEQGVSERDPKLQTKEFIGSFIEDCITKGRERYLTNMVSTCDKDLKKEQKSKDKKDKKDKKEKKERKAERTDNSEVVHSFHSPCKRTDNSEVVHSFHSPCKSASSNALGRSPCRGGA